MTGGLIASQSWISALKGGWHRGVSGDLAILE
jgi:hypothetical protein